jgi:hypothetical protein
VQLSQALGSCFVQDMASVFVNGTAGAVRLDVSGGWLPSGSPSKPLMPIAYTTYTLAWALTAFPVGFASAEVQREALANVRIGADYLLKSFDKAAGKLVVQVGWAGASVDRRCHFYTGITSAV